MRGKGRKGTGGGRDRGGGEREEEEEEEREEEGEEDVTSSLTCRCIMKFNPIPQQCFAVHAVSPC